jgi:hypothetical protein
MALDKELSETEQELMKLRARTRLIEPRQRESAFRGRSDVAG